jgi:hypothetical protein
LAVISPAFSVQVDSSGRRRPDLVALGLLGFAVAVLVFLLVPPLLRGDVGPVHGFTGQEAADLFTPLATMPLLVLTLELTGRMGTRTRVLLVILVSTWVAGQAIHLAANAMGDVFDAGPDREAFYGTPVGALDHFFDEVVGHWLWHVAWVGLLGLLLWAGAGGRALAVRPRRAATAIGAVAGLIHGFAWFVVTDEGGTWAFAIPATAVLLVAGWLTRHRDPDRVISTFLVVGAALTSVLYAIWVALYGWEPASICEQLKLC